MLHGKGEGVDGWANKYRTYFKKWLYVNLNKSTQTMDVFVLNYHSKVNNDCMA